MIVRMNNKIVVKMPLNELREIWEETSDRLDFFQIPNFMLKEQLEWRKTIKTINYSVNFDYQKIALFKISSKIFFN